MKTVESSIDVNVGVNTAYDQWTQFETLPQFMESVQSVQLPDETHLHWVVEMAGQTSTSSRRRALAGWPSRAPGAPEC